MKWTYLLFPLLALSVLAVSAAQAEDEAGPRCGLHAFVDEGDGGLLKVYDGLRKGLELAQLPRVCRTPSDLSREERSTFLRKAGTAHQVPIFAIGDRSVHALSGPMPEITRVFAVERYTVAGRPLLDLPVWDRLAVVYAARPAERVGVVLRGLIGTKTLRAYLPQHAKRSLRAAADRFAKAAGLQLTAANVKDEGGKPQVILHLRLAGQPSPLPFAKALQLARAQGVPLVSDERSRFGQGAVVTLLGRHDLLGKAAAECGRRLYKDPLLKIPPYGLPGVEVWVDLSAADRQKISVSLPFLARADRLERSPQPKVGRK